MLASHDSMYGNVNLVDRLVHHFDPDGNISTTIGWIARQFCAGIYGLKRMNSDDLWCLRCHLLQVKSFNSNFPAETCGSHVMNPISGFKRNFTITIPIKFGAHNFSSSTIIWSKFHFVSYFSSWPNPYKTNDIPMSLSYTLYLVLIRIIIIIIKCEHVKM